MRYVDYDLNINEDGINLDPNLKIPDNLGWQEGDHFELSMTENGVRLVKVDSLVTFVKGYQVNGHR